ncbi:nickel pincer cofactor biosynthesis protein LarC [Halobaculum sp. MBLA0143]|uniref:nickel pincer cofactor biosynthesis protein LarC n=1 Tax=Halobaculum sp. MBLA0143 TaxID=3079933 RepID=UPI003524B66A
MRTLAFDGRTGAAGDVILGTLVAAGADPAVLAPVTEALPVEYAFESVEERGVAATRARVVSTRDERSDGPGHDDTHDGDHDDHAHTHDHGDDGHVDAEGAGPERTYDDVLDVLAGMTLPERARADAERAFRLLGEAEAAVHGTDLGETTFHEVGTDDAIADVVGACLLLADLAPDRVVTTPVAAGGGEATFSHGTYPVPTPAVTEIAAVADWRLEGGPVARELLTPTGAAILAAVADGVDTLPSMAVDTSGYGAGAYDLDERPNVLRATVGETTADDGEAASGHEHDHDDGRGHDHDDDRRHDHDDGHSHGLHYDDVAVLETNLDDATPEVLGSLQETLPAAGAYDVTVVPTAAKKSRPGHLVKVLCDPDDAGRLAELLAHETGTLGVRQAGATHRWIADRRFEEATLSVDGEEHTVAVKVATTGDGVPYDESAEYDEALAVADATGLPVREVCRRAETAVRSRRDTPEE